ncbi:hypothetical protein CK203_070011 [Vitis vinifera]|uniref:Uncharacterized protein n=1 Tax=Vitis vinifera TaxID=29760 RepID=A0A438EQ83_VITVI|nr:hypothetical protein CK203_070011 [Vitis vinifera]
MLLPKSYHRPNLPELVSSKALFSSLSSPSHALLVDKAITLLKFHPPSPRFLILPFHPSIRFIFPTQVPIRPNPNPKIPHLGSEPPFLRFPLQMPLSPHSHPLQALQNCPNPGPRTRPQCQRPLRFFHFSVP